MPAYTNSTAQPNQELNAVIVPGQKMNRLNIYKQIAPLRPVSKRKGRMARMTIPDAGLLRIMDKIHMPGANIERYSVTVDATPFVIYVRKEEIKIPDEVEMDWATYFSVEAFAAQQGANRAELTLEYLTAQAAFNTTNFGAATNSSVAYLAANVAAINFAGDVIAAIRRGRNLGEVYDTIIIPGVIFELLVLTPLLLQFCKGIFQAQMDITVDSLVAAFAKFGIKQVLIGDASFNNAQELQPYGLVNIWSQSYVMVCDCNVPGKGMETGMPVSGDNNVSVGEDIQGCLNTLYWDSFDGGGGGFEVQTYRDENVMSNIVRTLMSSTPFVPDGNRGQLIGTQV